MGAMTMRFSNDSVLLRKDENSGLDGIVISVGVGAIAQIGLGRR